MRQMPDIEWMEEDPLDSMGTYWPMRRQLKSIWYGVLPHPFMGFSLERDQEKALEAIECAVKGRVSMNLQAN